MVSLSIRRFPRVITGDTRLQDELRSAPDIARLTRLMTQGDEAAYREFHEAYFARLLAYLLVVTRDEQAARESLQNTLLRVVRHIRRFDSEETFWSWLTVLARSSAFDERRRAGRYASFLERFFRRHQVENDVQSSETRSRLKELLESHLASLPAEDRELVERKYFERQSVRQIANDLQTSDKAIESRLVRIRQKLRETVLSELKYEE